MLDSTSVCLKLETIICTDWIVAKDCLFVPEFHWLAHDWLGKCHSQLVSKRFNDLRAGNKGDVTLMFVVRIHGRKTVSMLAMTLSCGFRRMSADGGVLANG